MSAPEKARQHLQLISTAAIAAVGDTHFNDKQCLDLALAICKTGSEETLDFESQRQLAWAFAIVLTDDEKLLPHDAKLLPIEIKAALATLQKSLAVPIPTRSELDEHREVEPNVAKMLVAAAHYRPKDIAAAWAVLREAIEKSPFAPRK